MAFARETSTDKPLEYKGEIPDIDAVKRPDWVNLTSLEPSNESLFDKLLYKPALRFHGLTGGIWGQGLSGPQSVITDSRPPSYKVHDPMATTYLNDTNSIYDQGSLRNNAQSRLTLRRRNTIAVVLVAVALLAAIAAVTGVILHFIQPKALLRANVRFTIANVNFSEEMLNKSSEEFNAIKRPLCGEMDIYFLTSELSEYYYGCKVNSLRKDKGSDSVAVHYTLDFSENKLTNDKDRIKRVLLAKSGRHKTNDTLFLVIDDFWVYLRSLRIDLEVVPMTRRPDRPWIPWRNDIDFINRESGRIVDTNTSVLLSPVEHNQSVVFNSSSTNTPYAIRDVLPNIQKDVLPRLTNRVYTHVFNVATPLKALIVSGDVLSVHSVPVLSRNNNNNNNNNIRQGHANGHIRPTNPIYLETTVVHGRFMDMNDLPVAREFNALLHERLEKKFEPGYTEEPINTRMDIHVNNHKRGPIRQLTPIEASFNPTPVISSNGKTETLFTDHDTVAQPVKEDDNLDTDKKKVRKIQPGVFLIVGSELFPDDLLTEKTIPLNNSPLHISSSTPWTTSKSFLGQNTHVNHFSADNLSKPNIINTTGHENAYKVHGISSSPVIKPAKEMKLLLKEINVLPIQSYVEVTSENLSESSSLIRLVHSPTTILYTSSLRPVLNNVEKTITLSDQMELQEVLVKDPVQKAVPPDNIPLDIQWINVLTLPEVTGLAVDKSTNHKVNANLDFDVTGTKTIIHNNNVQDVFESQIHPLKHSSRNNQMSITPSDSSEKEFEPFPEEEFNFTTFSGSNVLLPANGDNSGEDIYNEEHVVNQQQQVPNNLNKINTDSKMSLLNTQGKLFRSSPFARNIFEPGADSDTLKRRENQKHKDTSMRVRDMFRTHGGIKNDRLNSKTETISNKMPGAFALGNGLIKRTDDYKPRHNSRSRKNHGVNYIKTHKNTHSKHSTTLDSPFNHNIITASDNSVNAFNIMNVYYSKFKSRKHWQIHSNYGKWRLLQPPYIRAKPHAKYAKWHQYQMQYYNGGYLPEHIFNKNINTPVPGTNNYFVARPSSKWTNQFRYRKYIKPLWKPVVIPWSYFHTLHSIYGSDVDFVSSYVHNVQPDVNNNIHSSPFYGSRNQFLGLTESYNVSDIYEMKEILKHLIDAMHNMSNKLDKMQAAINFINQTLHEKKQPIHKLDNTFENMTRSFDNFNRNLNDITDILNDFKTFLRPFDNTIFNIDDILKHIDKTVDNLDKTRTFVGVSMQDLGESVSSITGTLSDLNSSLKHVNMSVFHVNSTATYTNKTLDSMENTLESLDSAIRSMNLKIDGVKGDIDGINISLSTINDTVQTSHSRLVDLQGRLNQMNGTVKRIKDNIQQLNSTYQKINETLRNMNEPIMVTKGTVLEVIDQLGSIDTELMNISSNMVNLSFKVDNINDSLDATLQWMEHMLEALARFNVTIETSNDTVSFSLQNIDIIDTVGILIKLNKTLHTVKEHIDKNNINIDSIEFSLDDLGSKLDELDAMLANMDHTFYRLNETLKDVNSTLQEIRYPLQTIDENIKRINYTFDDLDKTFDNINKTLEVANQTLVKVNLTKDEINKMLDQVTDNLNQTSRTVKRTRASVLNLNESLSHMDGSLESMKNELYYTNQTLKVVRDQVNTTVTSFENVRATLYEINDTLSDLMAKLDETEQWLKRTNTSLQDVNKTIEAIQETYDEMNEILDTLYASFNSTVTSLKDFRTAFPTLRGKIDKTADEIVRLQDQIHNVEKKLSVNQFKRNDSVIKHQDIVSLFEDVHQSILNEIEEFHDAMDYSDIVENEIAELINDVDTTEENFGKLDTNVKLIDKHFDELKTGHSLLSDESERLKDMMHFTENSLADLEDKKNKVLSHAQSYPSLRIPSSQIHSFIERQKMAMKNTKDTLFSMDSGLKDILGIIWDKDGNPVNIHDDQVNIKRNIQGVKRTLVDFGVFAVNASETIKDILENKETMEALFERINSTTANIDKIDVLTNEMDEKINSTQKRIQKNSNDLDTFKRELNDKISVLKQLKNELGKVNGTAAVRDTFFAVEKLIDTTESQIKSLMKQTRNASHLFLETKLKYTYANDSFHEAHVSVDEEGDTLLRNTFEALDETESFLEIIDGQIIGIGNASQLIDIPMNQLDRYTRSLKDYLENQTQHYAFVDTNRSALANFFDQIDHEFSDKSDMFNKLDSLLNGLHDFVHAIESKRFDMSNVDMSIEGERRLLNSLEMSVSELKTEVQIAFHKFETAQKNFQTFNHSQEELKSVKEEYSKLQNLLKNLDRVLSTVGIETSVIESRIHDLSQEFSSVMDVIDNYYDTKSDLVQTENSLHSLNINLADTTDKLSLSNKKVENIFDTLNTMIERFKKFPEASFNISSLPINNEVQTIGDLHQNISRDFKRQVNKRNATNSLFDDAKYKLLESPLSRFNLMRVINNDVNPSNDIIRDDIKAINDSLNDIKSRLRYLKTDIYYANNTLQSKQDRLTVDEEKDRLADKKFPDLEHNINDLKNLIGDAIESLKHPFEEYNRTLNNMDILFKGIDVYPTLDIPSIPYKDKLTSVSDILKNAMKGLKETSDLLSIVNNTVWVDGDKRYSHEESVDDISKRYNTASKSINMIKESLNEIQGNIGMAEQSLTNTSADIATLNKSLTAFETLVEAVNNITDNVTLQRNKSQQMVYSMFRTGNILDTLEQKINDTTNRFAHINQAVLQTGLHPLFVNTSYNREKYDKGLKDMVDVNLSLENQTSTINNMRQTLFQTVTDQVAIDDVIQKVTDSLTYLTPITSSSKTRRDLLQKQTDPISDELYSINENLDEAIKEFLLQEKNEYYDDHFKQTMYDSISDLINNSNIINEHLKDLFSKGQDKLNKLSETLKKTESVELNLGNIVHTFEKINKTLKGNERLISEMRALHTESSKYFNTTDGSKISDKESIDIMKERFRMLNDTLQHVRNQLKDISSNKSQKLSETIDMHTDEITHMDNTLKDLQETTNLLNEFHEKTMVLNESLQNNIFKNEDHVMTLDKMQDDFKILEILFRGVHNNKINNTKDHLRTKQTMVSNSINLIQRELMDDEDDVRALSETIGNMLARHENGFTNLDGIEKFLRNFSDIDPHIQAELSHINQSLVFSEHKVHKNNEPLKNIQNSLTSLRSQLLQEEKLNFIRDNAPYLQNSLQHAQDGLHTTNKNILSKINEVKLIHELFDTVKKEIKYKPVIAIPLHAVLQDIHSIESGLLGQKETMTQLNSSLNAINTEMFNSDGSYFVDIDPLSTLQMAYDTVNNTIRSANKSLASAADFLATVEDVANNTKQYLAEMLKEFDSRNEINSLTESLEIKDTLAGDDINKIDNDLSNINSDIFRLDNTLQSIKDKFWNVSDTKLWREASKIDSAIKDLHEQHAKSLDVLGDMKYQKTQSKFNIEQLQNKNKRISSSIDELKDYNRKSELAINKTDSILNELNRNIKNSFETNIDLKNDTQVLFDKLDDLKYKYTEKQMHQFVNATFPSILDKIEVFEKVLDRLSNNISELVGIRENVSIQMQKTRMNAEHYDLSATLKDVTPIYDSINQEITDAKSRHKKMKDELHKLVWSLNSDISSNDTLQNISKRFQQYNDTLKSMFDRVVPVDDNIATIQALSNDALRKLSNYDQQIEHYGDAGDRLNRYKTDVGTLERKLNKTESELRERDFDIKFLRVQMNFIEEKFQNVNQTDLDERKRLIQSTILALEREKNEFKDKVKLFRNNINALKDTIDNELHKDVLPVTNLHRVRSLSDERDEINNLVKEGIRTLGADIAFLSDDNVPHLNSRINMTNSLIDRLIKEYDGEEKSDYIKDNLPHILKDIDVLEQVLLNNRYNIKTLNAKISSVNESVHSLEGSLETIPNVFIPLRSLKYDIYTGQENSKQLSSTLDTKEGVMNNIDRRKLTSQTLQRLPLKEIKDLFRNLKMSLNETQNSLNFVTSTVKTLNDTANENDQTLQETNALLSRHMALKDSFNTERERLNVVNYSIDSTSNLLSKVNKDFKKHFNRFHELEQEFGGVRNPDIDRLYASAKDVINTVDLRLPLVNELYKNKTVSAFNELTERFKRSEDNFNSLITDKEKFKDVIDITELQIAQMSNDMDSLVNSERQYSEEGSLLVKQLDRFNNITNELEKSLKAQRKRDLLEEQLPLLKSHFYNTSNMIDTLNSSLRQTLEKLDVVNYTLHSLDKTLKDKPSLEIHLNDKLAYIEQSEHSLKDMLSNLKEAKQTMIDIPIGDIDIHDIVTNKSVSFDDVQEMIKRIRSPLSFLDNTLKTSKNDDDYIDSSINDIKHDASQLQEVLNDFMKTENKFIRLNDGIKGVNTKQSISTDKLNAANGTLFNLKTALEKTKLDFSTYNPDDKKIQSLLQSAERQFNNIKYSFEKASGVLEIVNDGFSDINNTLYKPSSSRQQLNTTLYSLRDRYEGTNETLSAVDKQFDDILNRLSPLDDALSSVDAAIRQLNTSMKSEDEKTSYINKNLPNLRHKYQDTNLTFSFMNKTFQEMENKLKTLDDFVDQVKSRMGLFQNINISLVNMTSNLTHMENRLYIMKEHYNNIKDIVSTLQKDLDAGSKFGKNVTLQDISELFNSYNLSIDNVDMVLGKIDMEFTEMDDHLVYLNETVVDIDNAIDDYELRAKESELLNEDITDLSNTLIKKDEKIHEMKQTIKDLNNTFENLQSLYTDVFKTTADKNTKFKQSLSNASDLLENVQQFLKTINTDQSQLQQKYDQMNESLNQDITSSDTFNDILTDAQLSYDVMIDAIDILFENVSQAKNHTSKLNSFLNNVVSLLRDINGTLHAEQNKYNYITDNLMNFDGELGQIDRSLNQTKQSLLSSERGFANATSIASEVSERMSGYPTVKFRFDNSTLHSVDQSVVSMNNLLDSMSKGFNDVKLDMSHSEDSTRDMYQLNTRYNEINQTLKAIKMGIVEMNSDISAVNSDTSKSLNKAKLINTTLDTFDEVEQDKNEIRTDLNRLSGNKTQLNTAVDSLANMQNEIKQAIRDQKRIYGNVETAKSGQFMDQLNILTDDFLSKIERLKQLNDTLRDFSDNYTLTNDNAKYLERLLETPLQNFDLLQYVTNNSEQIIPEIFNDVAKLHKTSESLSTDLRELKDEVAFLHSRILTVNESLDEEKKIEVFIHNHFKHLNKTYEGLKGKMDNTKSSISLALERTIGISDDLAQLNLKLEHFSAINISLDSENAQVTEEKKRLKELLERYANVSEAHRRLQVDTLKHTNKSLDEVKHDYEVFEKELQRLQNSLNLINGTVSDTNNNLDSLSTTISDINDTVDNYKRLETLISDQADQKEEANRALNYSKEAAREIEQQIKHLNDSLISLQDTFTQIKDPKLKATRDNIEHMLKIFSEDLAKLTNINTEMDSLSTDINQTFESVNETLYSTKKMLDTLKHHMQLVNKSSGVLANELNDVNSKQSLANDTASSLKPGLAQVLKELQNLTSSFELEQDNFDYVAKNKPVLEEQYNSLEDAFNDINKRISLTDLQLADLRYTIKTTDASLQKFKTLDITTDPEMNAWSERSNKVSDVSSKFVRLSSKYNLLRDDIQNLHYMNSTSKELQHKVNSIKNALSDIEIALERKNNSLKAITDDNNKAEAILEDLKLTMKLHRELQQNGSQTKDLMDSTVSAIQNSVDKLRQATFLKESIDDRISNMERTYRPIMDNSWSQKLMTLKLALSFEEDKLNLNSKNLGSIQEVMNTTTAAFNKAFKKLNEQPLTRQDVKNIIKMLDRNFRTMKTTFTDTDGQTNDADRQVSRVNGTLNDILNKLTALNETLFIELEKSTFVNETLPELQQKLVLVNGSFAENIPSSRSLKNQVSYLSIVLGNMEMKMKLYGIEDTDNLIRDWKRAVASLNETVHEIIMQNEEADRTLEELRLKLWTDKPMYTRAETLSDVRRRFDDFNRTLDDISLSSHTTNLKLKVMSLNSTNIGTQMENKDATLTTTTTPSAPPDWLSFKSSGTGTIAMDRGLLECSTTDLTDWDIMKITRVGADGKEQDMAAWKRGVGARKPRTFHDRRVRVKRVLDNHGGGKLQIGITSIQCVDEASYMCAVDTHSMWPLTTRINVLSPPEDSMEPAFPTEVFEDKVANFSCTGRPGYPNGRITWKIRRQNEAFFRDFEFYSAKSKVVDEQCTRTETNTVGYQFDMKWNNTRIRCYIENTDFFGEGIIRILPYSICNNVRDLGRIRHPYTPHKYIVCDRGLNIMQCPGKTCYDEREGNCVQCKASVTGGDPCRGQPLFTYVAHETDCKKFYVCMGPTKSTKRCSKGYFAKNVPGHCVMAYARSECAKKRG